VSCLPENSKSQPSPLKWAAIPMLPTYEKNATLLIVYKNSASADELAYGKKKLAVSRPPASLFEDHRARQVTTLVNLTSFNANTIHGVTPMDWRDLRHLAKSHRATAERPRGRAPHRVPGRMPGLPRRNEGDEIARAPIDPAFSRARSWWIEPYSEFSEFRT